MRQNHESGPRQNHRSLTVLALCASGVLLMLPSDTFGQTVCGAEVREEVARALDAIQKAPADEQSKLESELYDKYQVCGLGQPVPSGFNAAARQCGATVSNQGSLQFEEMSCVGYDPQRRQFAAPIKIKLGVGFGAAPLPGSRERVLHCVADAAGVFVPVGHDSVHLANAIANQAPTWQFAVVAAAHENLHTVYPMNGQTRRAKSILSWGFTPTSCNFTPIWGNALNYRIRLDQ